MPGRNAAPDPAGRTHQGSRPRREGGRVPPRKEGRSRGTIRHLLLDGAGRTPGGRRPDHDPSRRTPDRNPRALGSHRTLADEPVTRATTWRGRNTETACLSTTTDFAESAATESDRNKARKVRLGTTGLIGAVVIVWIVFYLTTDGVFLTDRNLVNLFRQTATTAIVATGMLIVIAQ